MKKLSSLMLLLAVSASAQTLDWSKDVVGQFRALRADAAAPAVGRVSVTGAEKPAPALSYFLGKLKLSGETRSVCFSLSPEKVDQFAGDPDMQGHGFVSQAISAFRERGLKFGGDCATALELNGNYIRTCSGLYLTEVSTLKSGPIFTKLERFDPNTGGLALQPAGRYELKSVASCPK